MINILKNDQEIWDLFTQKEEYNSTIKDKFDRFPYYASRNRHIFEPIVSDYLVNHGFRPEYPDNKSFAVFLTHDIDRVYTPITRKGMSALRLLKQVKFLQSFRSIAKMRSKKIPLCNFSAIMDLEEKYGAKSTFFFMAERPGEEDYAYDIEDLEPEIGTIIDRGWEVGLHGGHTTYLNTQEMQEKKRNLEKITRKPVKGYRNHFLRFKVPDTWEFLREAGFQYDTTYGYADCAGFRNGMCHPFRPFNLNTNQKIEIMEIPLVVMDSTLGPAYMRLDEKSRWDFVKLLIDRVAACHGVFTLLWHNTNFNGDDGKLFERILKYCAEKGACITSGEDIFGIFK